MGNIRKKSLVRRLAMPLPELEQYYREQRKNWFEQDKKLKHIHIREAFYPLFAGFLALDRMFRKQTVTVFGKREKYKEPVIYACTHIGENDLENIYEVLRRGCWWFVGDPCVLYKSLSGLLLHLNGCIMMETGDKDDRRIAYRRSVELLNAGGSLMIFPEGARNGTADLPVMELFPGTARMALETGAKIVPIAVEQYGKRFVINFGDGILPEKFQSCGELTRHLRDALASLKWEIWEREPLQARGGLPEDYDRQFREEFERRIRPYNTPEQIESTRYHGKTVSPEEAFAFLDELVPCRENAFLLRGRE